MCGAKEVVTNEQSSLKQQQTDLDLSVKQHHKHNQRNKEEKEEKETTDHNCLLCTVQNDLLWGETISLIHYNKIDANKLQEISLKPHKEQP